MPAVQEGYGLPRPGKAALRRYRLWKVTLNPLHRRYAEAYWRHCRREAVSPPAAHQYGVTLTTALMIERSIDLIVRHGSVR